MDTREFLAGLSFEQLAFAQHEAGRLIRAKEAEKKRVIWSLQDRLTGIELFSEDGYVMAAEALLQEARKRAADPGASVNEKALTLAPILVPESEYLRDVPHLKGPSGG